MQLGATRNHRRTLVLQGFANECNTVPHYGIQQECPRSYRVVPTEKAKSGMWCGREIVRGGQECPRSFSMRLSTLRTGVLAHLERFQLKCSQSEPRSGSPRIAGGACHPRLSRWLNQPQRGCPMRDAFPSAMCIGQPFQGCRHCSADQGSFDPWLFKENHSVV